MGRTSAVWRIAALAVALALLVWAPGSLAAPDSGGDPSVAAAKRWVTSALASTTDWTGPTTAPKPRTGVSIVYVAGDAHNAAARTFGDGAAAAAKALGWHIMTLDGKGTVTGWDAALKKAIAEKPDGIILGGIDAQTEKTRLDQAAAAGIKLVGFYAVPSPGPDADLHLFTNLATDPAAIGAAMGRYAIAASNGTAQVAILYDSQYPVAQTKAQGMKKVLAACKRCKVLDYESVPLAKASSQMPSIVHKLMRKFGSRLHWILSIADYYFDFATPALRQAGASPKTMHLLGSDGTQEAYRRIRRGDYQAATIPEPIDLFGWQAVDELNRAFHHQSWSHFMPAIHIVDRSNIDREGGTLNQYIPGNNYRTWYLHIWGKQMAPGR